VAERSGLSHSECLFIFGWFYYQTAARQMCSKEPSPSKTRVAWRDTTSGFGITDIVLNKRTGDANNFTTRPRFCLDWH